jgi:hypothetical protein
MQIEWCILMKQQQVSLTFKTKVAAFFTNPSYMLALFIVLTAALLYATFNLVMGSVLVNRLLDIFIYGGILYVSALFFMQGKILAPVLMPLAVPFVYNALNVENIFLNLNFSKISTDFDAGQIPGLEQLQNMTRNTFSFKYSYIWYTIICYAVLAVMFLIIRQIRKSKASK